MSVIIGSVAGLLGAIALGVNPREELPTDKLIALLGTGYAGADFIEAFMTRAGLSRQPAVPAVPPAAAPDSGDVKGAVG